jgi:hypothetical protein
MAAQSDFSYDAKSSPLLFSLIYDITKKIQINQTHTVFDRWLESNPNQAKTLPRLINIIYFY